MSLQTGIPRKLTYVGWLDSIKTFWRSPPDVPIHIVDYNGFFHPKQRERELRMLSEFLDREYDAQLAAQAFSRAVDNHLRNQVATSVRLPQKVARAYQAVLARRDQKSSNLVAGH